ncbi:MAG: hypothetical protein EXQ58_00860 [Acidobacteria bacterium]|nr:hypothetical protein [Acidobacteriota bacterium]
MFYWHQSLVQGHWDRRATERTDDLDGNVLGVVGLGRMGIARRVTHLFKSFRT